MMASGVALGRVAGVGVLEFVFVFPVLVRCAMAARGSTAKPIQSQVLKREEPKIIEPSISLLEIASQTEMLRLFGLPGVKK
jgi:hypothetical protein